MARHQRVTFSLPVDVVEDIDEQPKGERSAYVADAVRAYDGGEA